MTEPLTREQVEKLKVYVVAEVPAQTKHAAVCKLLLDDNTTLRARLEAVTQERKRLRQELFEKQDIKLLQTLQESRQQLATTQQEVGRLRDGLVKIANLEHGADNLHDLIRAEDIARRCLQQAQQGGGPQP